MAKLVDRLSLITQPRFKEGAAALAAKINAENGLEAGLAHFNRHLPLENMACDVSTLMRERSLGRHYYPMLRIKVSDEVHLTLSTSSAVDQRLLASRRPHTTMKWSMGQYVKTLPQGLVTGFLAAIWELVDGVISLVLLPIQAACWNGMAGFVMGVSPRFSSACCVSSMRRSSSSTAWPPASPTRPSGRASAAAACTALQMPCPSPLITWSIPSQLSMRSRRAPAAHPCADHTGLESTRATATA